MTYSKLVLLTPFKVIFTNLLQVVTHTLRKGGKIYGSYVGKEANKQTITSFLQQQDRLEVAKKEQPECHL